ncbi:MAG: nitrate reductase subunit alpha, partial [Desulfobacterales bacterium]
MALAPETNGATAVKSWKELEEKTGLTLTHLSREREGEKFSFSDISAQPRKIITSPTWSGIES